MSKKIKLPGVKKISNVKLFDYGNDVSKAGCEKGSHIELFSNRLVFIEDCYGVYEYSDMLIKLNIGRGSAVFCGNNLEITTLEGRNLTITGEISSIEFCV